MSQGFIYLHRQLIQSAIWREDPTKLKLFIYLLFRANHKDNGKFKRGEHITSYDKIREGTGLTRNTISKCLTWLAQEKYIEILPNKGTHVRIINYDKYQSTVNHTDDSTL